MLLSTTTPALFNPVHLALLGLMVLLSVATAWGVRHVSSVASVNRVLAWAGWMLLGASVLHQVWLLLPGNWDVTRSIPLHYSDLLRIVTALALIWQWRWAVSITYFWGLTLNLQAILTPHPSMLSSVSVDTVFYWVLHAAVLMAPFALFASGRHRVGWRDFAVSYTAALAWAAVAMSLNPLLGANYGFVTEPPEGGSLVDVLGPWPGYVAWMAVIAGVLWAAMTWPWVRSRGSVQLTLQQ